MEVLNDYSALFLCFNGYLKREIHIKAFMAVHQAFIISVKWSASISGVICDITWIKETCVENDSRI